LVPILRVDSPCGRRPRSVGAMTDQTEIHKRRERALAGNLEKDRAKLAAANKLFVRDRLALLLDDGSFVEDALLANALADDLPADGVVTGTGRIDGRPVCVMANDPTVKAGSWGARTVEKIVRLTETALKHELPVVYLVDSAGARMHATVSGCGDNLVADDETAIASARRWLSYLPTSWRGDPPALPAAAPIATAKPIADVVPAEDRRAYDMRKVVASLVDEDSFF